MATHEIWSGMRGEARQAWVWVSWARVEALLTHPMYRRYGAILIIFPGRRCLHGNSAMVGERTR
ncbi:hypothetical protein E2C01_024237 [Portunus trituberculatus]|uniref:Uncharacterized protein n=1 Tax=Portunus trituberculatus TaxID=210409 RepID=A0A5B7EC66_PORTR|nr:hypothetical protein [Portunus trituberculatus]